MSLFQKRIFFRPLSPNWWFWWQSDFSKTDISKTKAFQKKIPTALFCGARRELFFDVCRIRVNSSHDWDFTISKKCEMAIFYKHIRCGFLHLVTFRLQPRFSRRWARFRQKGCWSFLLRTRRSREWRGRDCCSRPRGREIGVLKKCKVEILTFSDEILRSLLFFSKLNAFSPKSLPTFFVKREKFSRMIRVKFASEARWLRNLHF